MPASQLVQDEPDRYWPAGQVVALVVAAPVVVVAPLPPVVPPLLPVVPVEPSDHLNTRGDLAEDRWPALKSGAVAVPPFGNHIMTAR